ncbi:MAG: hypothetical protein AAFW73_01350 [Bacteroidota bacterium]
MKLTFLLVGLLTYVHLGLHAQSYPAEWGPSYRIKGLPAEPLQLAAPESDQHYYLKTGGRRNGVLMKFNAQHDPLATKIIKVRTDGERRRLHQFIRTASGEYTYWTSHDRRGKNLKAYVSTWEGSQPSQPRQVYERQFDLSLLPNDIEWSLAPELHANNEGTMAAFFSPLGDWDLVGIQQLAVAVFDADLALVWDRQFAFPYPDRDVYFERVVVDATGEVLVLMRLYRGQRERIMPAVGWEDSRPFSYRIFRLTEAGLVEYELQLDAGLVPTDAGLFLPAGEPQQFLVAGFYQTEERPNTPAGMFLAWGQGGERALRVRSHRIEADFWEASPSDHRGRQQRPTTRALTIDRLIEFPDGTYGFLGEEAYEICLGGSENIKYNWGPIFLARFSRAGKWLGMQVIERYDKGEEPLTPSFALARDGERHWLVFNDRLTRDERQARMAADGQRPGRVDLQLVSIDGEGQIGTPQRLAPGRDPDLVFHPRLFALREGTLLLGKVSHVKYAFGSLELD